MKKGLVTFMTIATWAVGVSASVAQDFGQGGGGDLFNPVPSYLPPGKPLLSAGERTTPPGGRSPWHTAGGPKLLYLLDGTMTVEGISGQTLMICGPAPKLCLSPHKELFFFRNAGPGPLKFVVIGMDPVERLTNHEHVGQVTEVSGKRVTLAVGDLRTSELAVPRQEITIAVSDLASIAVGDNVVTIRHNEKDHTAERLVKLSQRWR